MWAQGSPWGNGPASGVYFPAPHWCHRSFSRGTHGLHIWRKYGMFASPFTPLREIRYSQPLLTSSWPNLWVRNEMEFSRLSSGVWYIYIYTYIHTECNRRNGPDFGRVFLRSYYTDITQNTYIQSSMVTEILATEVWNVDSYYSLIDYQIHIETGRNMWFL